MLAARTARTAHAVTALMLVIALGCVRPATTTTHPTVDEKRAVASRVDAFFTALGRADTTALRAVVTPEFYLLEHARWSTDTLNRLMGVIRPSSSQPPRVWSVENVCVTIRGDLAYATWESHPLGVLPWSLESGVFQRQDGQWRIAFFHSTRMPTSDSVRTRARQAGSLAAAYPVVNDVGPGCESAR